MKPKILLSIIAMVVVVGGAGFILMDKDTAKTDSSNKSSASQQKNTTTSDSPKIPFKAVGELADCSTYTFAELAPVWGVTFTDDDNSTAKVSEITGPNTKQFECDYNETDSGKGVTFVISYRQYADEARKTEMNSVRSTEKYGDTVYYLKEDKSGVGDEAFSGHETARTVAKKRTSNFMFVIAMSYSCCLAST